MTDTGDKISAQRGLVFDVKRFALHDGRGIRTTAFLKGCPLRCPWCQNPEGISIHRHVWYDHNSCIRCGRCAQACDNGAVTLHPDSEYYVSVDQQKCRECDYACVRACPTGALYFDSKYYTVKELADLLERDQVFYKESNGGITLSGGDPLFQTEFALEVFTECKRRGLHTAVETELATSRSKLERFVPVVDLFMSDLKIWDNKEHLETVGVENKLIKENLHYLAEQGVDLIVRMPLIPEITTTRENITAVAKFVAALPGDVPFELINFNPLASGKYRMLQKEYAFESYTSPYPPEEYWQFAQIAKDAGARIVGGP
ncbi:MAG: glycyl-radical enzyme activating protein [Spirochaetota bacterium]